MKRRRLLWLLPFGFGLISSCKRETGFNHSSSSPPIAQTETTTFNDGDTIPPHCEALSLVWSTQQTLIKGVEIVHANREQKKQKEYVSADGRWWFDCDSRQWEITRPFSPGIIDSTHLFDVQYKIDGQVLAAWLVDTREKTIRVSMNTLDQERAT